MKISEELWGAFVAARERAMRQLEIEERVREEFLALIQSFHDDVVTAGADASEDGDGGSSASDAGEGDSVADGDGYGD